MKNTLILALCAGTALTTTALPAQERPTAGSASVPEIETIGSGERRIAPDRATVMVQIESRASSAAAAAAMNATAAQAVRDALRRMRVDTAAATASYHVGPEFGPPRPADREEAPRVIGYIARTVVRARITQLDQLGPAMDAALAAGATGIEGLFFESSGADDARRAALADAAAAARRDAEVLARAMGGSLGAMIGTSTLGMGDPRRYNLAVRGGYDFGGVGATQITPTEIVITAAVAARWRFLPPAP
jgi:uncharacterized protein